MTIKTDFMSEFQIVQKKELRSIYCAHTYFWSTVITLPLSLIRRIFTKNRISTHRFSKKKNQYYYPTKIHRKKRIEIAEIQLNLKKKRQTERKKNQTKIESGQFLSFCRFTISDCETACGSKKSSEQILISN